MKATIVILTLGIVMFFAIGSAAHARGGEEAKIVTDQAAVRAKLVSGGWHVAYGSTYQGFDWSRLAACSTYQCINAHFDSQLTQAINKFERPVTGLTAAAIRDLILKAVKAKGTNIRRANLQVSAGLATYKRWLRIVYQEPHTYPCKWGMCTTLVEKEKTQPLPDHQQPYIKFRFGDTPDDSVTNYFTINFSNKCSKPIQAAIRYKKLDNTWATRGWILLNPRQTASLAKTKNTIYYSYAESVASAPTRKTWSGNDGYYPVQASPTKYGFAKKDITSENWGTWTQSFSCN
jgi:hypothetical protein